MRELELIDALEDALAAPAVRALVRWLGDDAAVVRARGYAVTSVDAMVDGVHFRSGQLAPEEIGHRALAGALSDLAAMGRGAGEAYLALGLPAGVRASSKRWHWSRRRTGARRARRGDDRRRRRHACRRPDCVVHRRRLGGGPRRAGRPRRRAPRRPRRRHRNAGRQPAPGWRSSTAAPRLTDARRDGRAAAARATRAPSRGCARAVRWPAPGPGR